MKKNANRPLKLETLESRNLMAGNVVVDLFPSGIYHGDVRVTGDNLGNGVEIREISSGTYRVQGVFTNGAMTTVNGKNFVDIYTRNDDLWIDMKGGDDYLVLGNPTGIMTVEDLGIKMGSGSDAIILGNIDVYERSQPCNIDMGSESENQHDAIAMGNATFRGALNLSTGGGDDWISMKNVQVSKRLSINAGKGTDWVEISSSSADEIFASMGGGNQDELTVKGTRARRLNADGGLGSGDKLRLLAGNTIGSTVKSGFE